MSGHCAAVRISLGVYVLGAIEPAERAVAESHLAGCPACRDELALLSGLPGLLGRLSLTDVTDTGGGETVVTDTAGDDDAAPGGGPSHRPVNDLGWPGARPGGAVDRALARLERRRRAVRRRLALAAAALAVVAAGASAAVTAVATSQPERPPGQMLTAVDAASRIQATVWVAGEPTGTAFTVRLRGVPPGTHCVLVALGGDGRREIAASWVASYYGRVDVRGASGIAVDRLTKVLVISDGGEQLVALPYIPNS